MKKNDTAKPRSIVRRLSILMLSTGLVWLSGCTKTFEWTEETKLADGRVVDVTRRWRENRFPDFVTNSRYKQDEQICVPALGVSVLSTKDNEIVGIEGRDGKVYIKMELNGTEHCKTFGKPELPFGHMKLHQNSWEKVELGDYPGGNALNLMQVRPGHSKLPADFHSGRILLSKKLEADRLVGTAPFFKEHYPQWQGRCEKDGAASTPYNLTIKLNVKRC